MSKPITISDIARHLNYTPNTISRALNNHPAVNKKTRRLIIATAYSLGYKSKLNPNYLIGEQQTGNIGLILPGLDSHFRNAIVAGVESITAEAGYKLLSTQTQDSLEKGIQNARIMLDSRVDGLLVSMTQATEDIRHFLPFLDKNIPVIFFEVAMEHKKCQSMMTDNMQAAYIATTHLIEQGCRNIMCITGNPDMGIYADRLKGYKYAHFDQGVTFVENNRIISDLSVQAGIKAAEFILQMKQLPDGIFASSDTCAASCMVTLKKAGIKIPQDIAIVGFNNDPISTLVEPNLTTINYPRFDMGREAAKKLLAQINNLYPWQDSDIAESIFFKSELIVRGSSGKNGCLNPTN